MRAVGGVHLEREFIDARVVDHPPAVEDVPAKEGGQDIHAWSRANDGEIQKIRVNAPIRVEERDCGPRNVLVRRTADSNRMALPWPRLRMSGLAIGVGGAVREFSEPAALAFRDTDGGTYVYRLNISIMPPSTIMGDIPSLLGRDILNRWRMVYDPSIDELSFEVHTADRTLAPRPSGR